MTKFLVEKEPNSQNFLRWSSGLSNSFFYPRRRPPQPTSSEKRTKKGFHMKFLVLSPHLPIKTLQNALANFTAKKTSIQTFQSFCQRLLSSKVLAQLWPLIQMCTKKRIEQLYIFLSTPRRIGVVVKKGRPNAVAQRVAMASFVRKWFDAHSETLFSKTQTMSNQCCYSS